MIPQHQQEHNHPMPFVMAFGIAIVFGGFMLLIVSFSHSVGHSLAAIGIMLVGLTIYLASLGGFNP